MVGVNGIVASEMSALLPCISYLLAEPLVTVYGWQAAQTPGYGPCQICSQISHLFPIYLRWNPGRNCHSIASAQTSTLNSFRSFQRAQLYKGRSNCLITDLFNHRPQPFEVILTWQITRLTLCYRHPKRFVLNFWRCEISYFIRRCSVHPYSLWMLITGRSFD